MAEVVDLFAGPGGWDEGLKALGFADVEGIENDAAACATAESAGHVRRCADITDLDPFEYAGTTGLIGSPPCPGFSAAGKGLGRKDLQLLTDAIAALGGGVPAAVVLDVVRQRQHDPRSALTLEPLRWALALEPAWVALEQVPAVRPLWQAYAETLTVRGYNVWTGYLHAEQYGVPQTRKRALLLASRTSEVDAPAPTHSRYHSRTPAKLDEGVARWVSMADALGWGMTARPYPTIACSRTTGGPDKEKVGGSAARASIYAELAAGRWSMASGTRARAALRNGAEPAGTLAFGHDAASYAFVPADAAAGDVAELKRAGTAIRLSLTEAAVLQTFRADYPFHGSKSEQFRQIGNAVPPLLAARTISALTGRALTQEAAA